MLEDKDLLSIQEVRSKVEKAYAAWQKYRHQTNARIQQNPGAAAAGNQNNEPIMAKTT